MYVCMYVCIWMYAVGPGDGRSPGGETIVCMAIAIAGVHSIGHGRSCVLSGRMWKHGWQRIVELQQAWPGKAMCKSSNNGCCADVGHQCYAKNKYWAQCMYTCDPTTVSKHDLQRGNWSCDPIGTRYTPYYRMDYYHGYENKTLMIARQCFR